MNSKAYLTTTDNSTEKTEKDFVIIYLFLAWIIACVLFVFGALVGNLFFNSVAVL